jgi:hypothetical protein
MTTDRLTHPGGVFNVSLGADMGGFQYSPKCRIRAGDKKPVFLFVFEPLECFESAFSALITAWNLNMWGQESYEYQGIRLAGGKMIVSLSKRSRH